MSKQRCFVSTVLTLGLALGLIGGALAQAPTVKQPRFFMRAYTDLRFARAWLNAPSDKSAPAAKRMASYKIDLAMKEIKRAAYDDGKDINDHPVIDNNIKGKDRMQKVLTLLLDARVDLNSQKDPNNEALGWRKAAMSRTTDAINLVKQIMNEK